jgi:hypothetical protein
VIFVMMYGDWHCMSSNDTPVGTNSSVDISDPVTNQAVTRVLMSIV